MRKVIVEPGQTMLDIALQYTGSAMGIVTIAKANKLSIGEPLEPGTILLIGDVVDMGMYEAMTRVNVHVASLWPIGIFPKVIIPPSGIGVMIIGTTFEIA